MAINWQDVITSAFATVGGGAVLLGAVAWLLKAVINDRLKANADAEIERVKNTLMQETEAFKIRLKADADVQNEQLKTSLQMTALEHEVRFSKLHEKRAEVIADLYARFVKAYWAAWTYHQWTERPGGPTQEQQADSARQKLHKAFVFFEINRIYLSDPLAGSLDVFFERAKILTLKAQYFDAKSNKTEHVAQLHHDARTEGLEAFQKEFPEMRQRLDAEFKRLIEPKQSKDW